MEWVEGYGVEAEVFGVCISSLWLYEENVTSKYGGLRQQTFIISKSF